MVERNRAPEAENYVLRFLENGRENWDIPHTRAVVFYAEKLAEAAGLDVLVFITAAWFHDVGYYGQFEGADSSQYADIKDKKALHMEIGAKMAREFLESPALVDRYTPEQIEQVVHLIEIHDNLRALTSFEEFVFMEADTLGAIDLSRVIPTFDKENGLKYIESLKTRRMPGFVSELGKRYLSELLPIFEAYFRAVE